MGTTYNVRAYATSGNKTSYGQNVKFATYVMDVDGNIYKTIVISNQTWMAENLKTTRYQNGTPIPNVTVSMQWNDLSTGAWGNYGNQSSNDAVYGKLYNWFAVNDPRQLCPTDWHVPTMIEWTELTTNLGGEEWAGGKMKITGTLEAGTGLWLSPNTGATNESGFSGLPGGIRYNAGTFNGLGGVGQWWSSTDVGFQARNLRLDYSNDNVELGTYPKTGGFYVRCMR